MTEQYEIETSSGGIVYKKKGLDLQWLIIQHSTAKHWGFPKGHVADKVKEEKLEEAALREVFEEGGIKAKIVSDTPITTTYFFKMEGILRKKTVHYFLMEYLSGNTQDHDWEVQEAKFVSKEELLQTLTYESDIEAFKKIMSGRRTNI